MAEMFRNFYETRDFALKQARRLEAGISAVADNDVIVQGNADLLGSVSNLVCHLNIIAAWCRVAAWMVMDDDQGRGVKIERSFHNLPGIKRRMVDRATLLHLICDQPVLVVQK